MSNRDPIPEEVRALLRRHFRSVSEIETLLVLVRDARRWTLNELCRKLVLNETHVVTLLDVVVRARLVKADGGTYWFEPRRTKDRAAVEELARIYDTYRVRIMNIVLSQPSRQASDFADAFRLRSTDDDAGDE